MIRIGIVISVFIAITIIGGVIYLSNSPDTYVVEATKIVDLESLFRDQEPWLGADGAYSLDISEFHPNTILWTFGDTLWGAMDAGVDDDADTDGDDENRTRAWTAVPNNSIALYDYENDIIEFYHKEPKKVFEIAEWGEGNSIWGPWPFAPFIQNEKIYWFLEIIDLEGFAYPVGDWLVDVYLAEVVNPEDNPESWKIDYCPIDFLPVKYEDHSFLWLATDVYVEDSTYYMYGVRQEQVFDEENIPEIMRYFVVARTQEDVTNLDSWEFYDGESWTSIPQIVKGGPTDLSTEYSVNYLPIFDRYLLIYQNDRTDDLLLKSSIWGRWGDTPVGPWSEPQVLYTPEELYLNEDYWVYAAKAHYPYFSENGNEVVVSYIVRSYSEEETMSDPALYCPYFVKLVFTDG